MTIKNLLETAVDMPDRVVIIDTDLGNIRPFNIHNKMSFIELKKYHYGKTVEKWIVDKMTTASYKITDPYTGSDKGWKETIYIQIKSKKGAKKK